MKEHLKALPDDDRIAFLAALGWLELGNPGESLADWSRISVESKDQPAVLDLGWSIRARMKDWREAYDIADRMVHLYPARAGGWIHRAYSARRRSDGGLSAALAALWPASNRFPREPIIPYNLACYAAQLGQLEDAWSWYLKATERGNASDLRDMALSDSDLEPIWPRIRDHAGL